MHLKRQSRRPTCERGSPEVSCPSVDYEREREASSTPGPRRSSSGQSLTVVLDQ